MLSRKRHAIRVFLYFFLELLMVAASFFAGYAIRRQIEPHMGLRLDPLQTYLPLLPIFLLVWSAFLWIPNTYDRFRSRSGIMHVFTAALTSGLSVVALFAIVTIFKLDYVNRSLVAVIGGTAFATLLLTRLIARGFLSQYTLKG